MSQGGNIASRCLTALKDSNPSVRAEAADALGNLDDQKATNALISLFTDDEKSVRSNAAKSLGGLEGAKALEPLISALNDREQRVRLKAAESLGRLGNGKAVDPLISALKDSSPGVRMAAVRALGELGDKKAVDSMESVLEDPNPGVRAKAARTSGTLGNRKVVPVLVKYLFDWDTAKEAAKSLPELGWKPSSEREQAYFQIATMNLKTVRDNWPSIKRVLYEDLESQDGEKVKSALSAFVVVVDEDTMPDLLAVVGRTESKHVAETAFHCLHAGLRDAANDWAVRHGQEFSEYRIQGREPIWLELGTPRLKDRKR